MANPAHRTDTPAGAWQEGILHGQALWPSDRVTLAAASMVIEEHRGSNDSVCPRLSAHIRVHWLSTP